MEKVRFAALQPEYIPASFLLNYLGGLKSLPDLNEAKAYMERQLKITLDLIETAGSGGCDAILTSEDITGLQAFALDTDNGEFFNSLAGCSAQICHKALSEAAIRHDTNIIGCFGKREDSFNYNVAAFYDRKGRLVGEYRKTHLPADEKWQYSEGDRLEVFDLDIGRAGALICYDIMFPEPMRVLALKGAQMVFHPTLGYGWRDQVGEATLMARAGENSVHLITAKNYSIDSTGRSSITDPWGIISAKAPGKPNTIALFEADPSEGRLQPPWHVAVQTSGIRDVGKRMLLERRPELYEALIMAKNDMLILPDDIEKRLILERIREGRCHW